MVKQMVFGYRGMKQDIAKSKHPPEFYFDALNIDIAATTDQTAAVMTNEKGNKLAVTIPKIAVTFLSYSYVYNHFGTDRNRAGYFDQSSEMQAQKIAGKMPESTAPQLILGMQPTRDSIIIFSTNNNGTDIIWELVDPGEPSQNIYPLYIRDMGFSTDNPITTLFNYENVNIQKVYWIDGTGQMRNINIKHSSIKGNKPLMELPLNSLSSVGEVSFTQPVIDGSISGGNHTSGMVQYAYNLYRTNSSQTKLSPISRLYPLAKENGGGEVNEIVGTTPIVRINGIDTSYSNIRVYAIKYTAYNQIPSINLIEDREISGESLVIYDNGSTILSMSLEELLFLGSDPIIPQDITSKDGRMFLFNIKRKNFVVPDSLDTRAYSFDSSSRAKLVDEITGVSSAGTAEGSTITITSPSTSISPTHDTVNPDYDRYKYQSNGSQLGGEGPYIKYSMVKKTPTDSSYRYFKDNEIYRIGIQFYNKMGQTSLPKWIADFKAPDGNLKGLLNTLKVTFKPEFYTWLSNQDFQPGEEIVGYKILRAERNATDRTIVAQGMMGSMMVNSPRSRGSDKLYTTTEKRADSDNRVKMPNILMRNNSAVDPLQGYEHLLNMQFRNNNPASQTETGTQNPLTEIQFEADGRKADTYQYNTMFQMYSPEVIFGTVSLSSGMHFQTKGLVTNEINSYWGQERAIETKGVVREAKVLDGIHPQAPGVQVVPINGEVTYMMDRGLISDASGSEPDKNMPFNQFYRKYGSYVQQPVNVSSIEVYGTPLLVEKGQSNTVYNNNGKYEFTNTLQGFLSDSENDFSEGGQLTRTVVNINSDNARNITFVLGPQNDIASYSRQKFGTLISVMGATGEDKSMVGELRKPKSFTYLGGIYGGNSYEDKRRTSYVQIGSYQDINEDIVQIDSPGDTFVGIFRFERISKTNQEIYATGNVQYTEIVEFPVETTVDLTNRNDISLSNWDTLFQPKYDEYHNYNTVYSQQSDLIKVTDIDYNIGSISDFDTRIQATKLKLPNETIDNWTDILDNEFMDLDGKYGPINGVSNTNDIVYTLQDNAVAHISINPRVVINTVDGGATELGKGGILDKYQYLTTNSGCINKWSIMNTSVGFYYYDLLNKSWINIRGNQLTNLTDKHSMGIFFRKNTNYDILKDDNPLIGRGISTGYNPITNTVYLTMRQYDDSLTISFNERWDSFVSTHSYKPASYLDKGFTFLSTGPGNDTLYVQGEGRYNNFYGIVYDSNITFQMNPPEPDCVFNNLDYKGEMYNAAYVRQDRENLTFNSIRAWNEYLDSGEKELKEHFNISRRMRNWRITIPRNEKTLARMRGHWIYLRLSLKDNTDNNRMVIHDMQLYYSAYPY